MSYQNFQQAKQRLDEIGKPKPLTVEQLQRHVLSVGRLGAIQQIQAAMESIAKMESAINQLATLHALPVRRINLYQVGMLGHEIEGLLFEHGLSTTRLERGGIPVAGQDVGEFAA